MCPLQPGRALFHLAMKVGMTWKRWPISFTLVLKRTPRSAASRASAAWMAASNTPGPVSVCSPSMGTPNAPSSSSIALKKGRLWAMRTSE